MTFIDTRKPYWEREGRGSKQGIRRIQYKLYLPNEIVAMKLYLCFQNILCAISFVIIYKYSILTLHIKFFECSFIRETFFVNCFTVKCILNLDKHQRSD